MSEQCKALPLGKSGQGLHGKCLYDQPVTTKILHDEELEGKTDSQKMLC